MAAEMEQLRRDRERAEKELKEAEKKVKEEQMARERAERERDIAEDMSRDTTLCEFLELCHEHFTRQLTVETNEQLRTGGGVGSPVGNKRPDRLEPWTNFIEIQQDTLTRLFAMYPMDDPPKTFSSKKGMSEFGASLFNEALASEKDLEIVLKPSIVIPVRRILEHLKDIRPVADYFELDGEITFKGHKIPEARNESPRLPSAEQLRVPFTPPKKSTSDGIAVSDGSSGTTGIPDWLCFYSHEATNTRLLVLILEYKPPHKLTVSHLRHGLRPMDICEVEDKSTYALKGDAPDAHFQEQADLRVATVVTQAYSYMIDSTLEHGIISTGQGFVFLKIDYKTPNIVYYYLSVPWADIAAQRDLFPNDPAFFHRTAVCQVLAFTLNAVKSTRYRPDRQEMIRQANKVVKKWQRKPDAERFKDLPETPEKEVPGSEYRPSAFRMEVGGERHRMMTRGKLAMQQQREAGGGGKRVKRGGRESCRDLDDAFASRDRDDDDPSDNREPQPQPANLRLGMMARGQNTCGATLSTPYPDAQAKGASIAERGYCTQGCLWGLVQGGDMDTGCPNYGDHAAGHYVSLHGDSYHENNGSTPLPSPTSSRSASPLPPCSPTTHPLPPSCFLPALTAHLTCDPDTDILPIYYHVSSHAGFLKISLRGYGYTVFAKGVPSSLECQLRWEEEIYKTLGKAGTGGWGWCGGVVVVEREEDGYYFDIGMKLTRFLILSHCGLALDPRIIHPVIGKCPPLPPLDPRVKERVVEQAKENMREIHRRGVLHGDLRAANLVWDEREGRVGVIDFGRGEVVTQGREGESSPGVEWTMRGEVERVERIVRWWIEGGNLRAFG
jgi:Phosphotransferase enzyme family